MIIKIDTWNWLNKIKDKQILCKVTTLLPSKWFHILLPGTSSIIG
jgi:hypothetical protein